MAYTLGIDVSYWQDRNDTPEQIDFKKAKKAGAEFVFNRGCFGLVADSDLIYNMRESKAAGLIRGTYGFMVYSLDPVRQAEAFWKAIEHDPGELRPVADYEWWNLIPSNAIDLLERYITRLEQLCGKPPILYTGPYHWRDHGRKDAKWKRHPLWLAQYPWKVGTNHQCKTADEIPPNYKPMLTEPWGDNGWTFWQWSSKGDGVKYGMESLDLDMDFFNGTLDELRKFAGLDSSAPEEVSDAEKLDRLWNAHRELH